MRREIVFVACFIFAGSAWPFGPKGGETRLDEYRDNGYGIDTIDQVRTNLSEGNMGLLKRSRGDKDRPVPKAKMKRQRNAGNTYTSSGSDHIQVKLSSGDKDRPIPRIKKRHRTAVAKEVAIRK